LYTIIIVHNTVTQRQFLFIFPFLQTNITSQMWPTGGKGVSFITTQVTHRSMCSGRTVWTVPNNMRKWSQRCRPLWDFAAHSSRHHQRYRAWQHETVHHCPRLCEDRTGDATAPLSQEASTQLTPAQWQNLYNIKWCDANTLKTDYNHSSSR